MTFTNCRGVTDRGKGEGQWNKGGFLSHDTEETTAVNYS